MEDSSTVGSDEESSSVYDSSDDDDSSFDCDLEEEAQRFIDSMETGNIGDNAVTPPQPVKQPEEVWAEYIEELETNSSRSIKVTDTLIAWIAEMPNDAQRVERIEQVFADLLGAITRVSTVIHVILGHTFLSLLNSDRQERLYQEIAKKHSKTITYWKLGSDNCTEMCGIPTASLLQSMCRTEMSSQGWESLTELEIRGLKLTDHHEIELLETLVKQSPKIRQFNLLGINLSRELVMTEGLFDELVSAVGEKASFDELQLSRKPVEPLQASAANLPFLISPHVLEHLLAIKPKWWRVSLDGLGLEADHLAVMGKALKTNKNCKMNDLLSIKDNPKISTKDLERFYRICLSKQRMGLVLSDDQGWVATFDLVRPLNNLHRRLEYLKDDGSGEYISREKWVNWLNILSNLPWIDDSRKLNYVWFTLMEQPELIQSRE